MYSVAFGAFHVIATGTKNKDVSAAVGVGFERFVSFGNKVENIAIDTHISKTEVAPNEKACDACGQ